MWFFAIGLLCLLVTTGAAAYAQTRPDSDRLPITVAIIDFQTTKRICGAGDAPSWCPAHLLNDPEILSEAAAEDTAFKAGLLDDNELAKRKRIQDIKDRLSAENDAKKM